ncbi:MAG TPA: helix-turn-helix domain-containing protein [Arsenicitalea sp.]|nr:helix-turn-helix domain-containing protein [Arsenicitalea sp.]
MASSRYMGVSIGLEQEKRAGFSGTLSVNSGSSSTLATVEATGHFVRRGASEIAQLPTNTVMIYQQRSGSAWFAAGDGAPFVVTPGDIAIGNYDAPFTSDTIEGARRDFRLVSVPASLFGPLSQSDTFLPLRPVAASGPGAGLFSAYFEAFCREFEHLTDATTDLAARTLAQLATLASGLAPADSDATRLGVREAKRRLLLQHIDACLADPRLSPATSAAALGMSVRQVHQLFEPTGTTFARHVLVRRLDWARAMLLRDSSAVIGIAYGCGFDSITTFNRAFRKTFGMSPTELRRALQVSGSRSG